MKIKYFKVKFNKQNTEEKYELGHIYTDVGPYLTDEESKKMDEIIDAGLKRDISVDRFFSSDSGKPLYREFEGKTRSEITYMISHLWFSARPYLTDQEKKNLSDLYGKGYAQKRKFWEKHYDK